jgi:5-methylcytosine-specific restriction endonuclease McrA
MSGLEIAVPVRPCLGLPGRPCGRLTSNGSRCEPCRLATVRQRSSARGTRQAQGYDNDWLRLSAEVIRRDLGICHYCGGTATTADHVVPKSKGGPSDLWNLVAACRPCNSAKRDR